MAMTPEERAAQYNAEREREDTPSPQAMEAMRRMVEEKRRKEAEARAYDAASKLGPRKAKGGKISGYAKGGYVRSADGCAQRGKTKGKMV